MSSTDTWNDYIISQPKQTGSLCSLIEEVDIICPQILVEESDELDERDLSSERKRPLLSVKDKKFTDSFHRCANERVVSWFFLVASSCISLRKNVNFFDGLRRDHGRTTFLPDRTILNAEMTLQNDLKYEKAVVHLESLRVDDAIVTNFQLRFSGSWESSHRCSYKNPLIPLGSKCDSSSEISDLDRASYWDSFLSLEEEDYEWISDSKPYGFTPENPSTPTSAKCDSPSEISELDRVSSWDSLLSLEEEDCEWISDSKPYGFTPENPSTPTSAKCDSPSEISELDRVSSWDSLLSLEEEDCEWISDSKPYGFTSENPSTPTSAKCDSPSESSELDGVSYWDSLLSLEEGDCEWISDSKPYGFTSENPSTPTSAKCDSPSEISELDRVSYWDSLLSLEEEDCEWISDSKPGLEYFRNGFPSPSSKSCWGSEVLPSLSTTPSVIGIQGERSENNISAEHILETADMEEVSANEPLFWPFQGKFNWNSEESWSSFSMSPRKHMNGFSTPNKSVGLKLQGGNLELKKRCRRRLAFGSRSTTSRTNEWKQKGEKSVCGVKSESSRLSMSSKSSAKATPLGSKDDKGALKYRVMPCIKLLSAGKTFLKREFASIKELPMGRDDFAFDQELPIETLVGLKEFDGHEGLHSEFNDDFMLDESF